MFTHFYPTVAEAIEAHRILVEEFGGAHGVRDAGLLESAIFRPLTGYYGGLLEEAAALMESLTNNHPFVDGNKRVAFAVADTMLRSNGYFLDVEGEAANEFIRASLAAHEFRFSKILEWLQSIVQFLPQASRSAHV
jgi:death on curing protein